MHDKKNPKYAGVKTDTYDLKYGEHDEDVEEELDAEEEEMSTGYSLPTHSPSHRRDTTRGPSSPMAHGTPPLYP